MKPASGPAEINRRLRVAVVEDGADTRELLSIILRDSFHVITYRTAEEALPFLLQDPSDVIIIDLRLPLLDGITLLQILRAGGVRTPAIMMTAHVAGNVQEKVIASGFSAFIPKPIVDLDGLEELIRNLASGPPPR